jgi:hypothetical protein
VLTKRGEREERVFGSWILDAPNASIEIPMNLAALEQVEKRHPGAIGYSQRSTKNVNTDERTDRTASLRTQ